MGKCVARLVLGFCVGVPKLVSAGFLFTVNDSKGVMKGQYISSLVTKNKIHKTTPPTVIRMMHEKTQVSKHHCRKKVFISKILPFLPYFGVG